MEFKSKNVMSSSQEPLLGLYDCFSQWSSTATGRRTIRTYCPADAVHETRYRELIRVASLSKNECCYQDPVPVSGNDWLSMCLEDDVKAQSAVYSATALQWAMHWLQMGGRFSHPNVYPADPGAASKSGGSFLGKNGFIIDYKQMKCQGHGASKKESWALSLYHELTRPFEEGTFGVSSALDAKRWSYMWCLITTGLKYPDMTVLVEIDIWNLKCSLVTFGLPKHTKKRNMWRHSDELTKCLNELCDWVELVFHSNRDHKGVLQSSSSSKGKPLEKPEWRKSSAFYNTAVTPLQCRIQALWSLQTRMQGYELDTTVIKHASKIDTATINELGKTLAVALFEFALQHDRCAAPATIAAIPRAQRRKRRLRGPPPLPALVSSGYYYLFDPPVPRANGKNTNRPMLIPPEPVRVAIESVDVKRDDRFPSDANDHHFHADTSGFNASLQFLGDGVKDTRAMISVRVVTMHTLPPQDVASKNWMTPGLSTLRNKKAMPYKPRTESPTSFWGLWFQEDLVDENTIILYGQYAQGRFTVDKKVKPAVLPNFPDARIVRSSGQHRHNTLCIHDGQLRYLHELKVKDKKVLYDQLVHHTRGVLLSGLDKNFAFVQQLNETQWLFLDWFRNERLVGEESSHSLLMHYESGACRYKSLTAVILDDYNLSYDLADTSQIRRLIQSDVKLNRQDALDETKTGDTNEPEFSFSTPTIDISDMGAKYQGALLGVGHLKVRTGSLAATDLAADNTDIKDAGGHTVDEGGIRYDNHSKIEQFRRRAHRELIELYGDKYIEHDVAIYCMYFYVLFPDAVTAQKTAATHEAVKGILELAVERKQEPEQKKKSSALALCTDYEMLLSDAFLPIHLGKEHASKYKFSLFFPAGLARSGKEIIVSGGEGNFYSVTAHFDLASVLDDTVLRHNATTIKVATHLDYYFLAYGKEGQHATVTNSLLFDSHNND